jgi:hypothetical protein
MTSCADYERHERLLLCTHREPTMVAVYLADGCRFRICGPCRLSLGVKRWPDVVELVPGPARGLDLVDLLMALRLIPDPAGRGDEDG